MNNMNNKEKPNNTVKMYWQEVPSEDNQVKNVLPSGAYCEPANIVNSTHVNVDPKPWLQNTKLKKDNVKTVSQLQTNPKSNSKSKSKHKNNDVQGSIEIKNDNTSNYSQPFHTCSLAELRKEDKQRVADLVREMAKFSEEKDTAVKELNTLKSDFTSKLKMVEDEKQRMITERDSLKEKLLRYELVLSEIKDSRKNSNENGVDTILNNHVSLQDVSEAFHSFDKAPDVKKHKSPEEYPGNTKEAKSNVVVDNSSEDTLKCLDNEKQPPGEDIDKLTYMFFKQQDKFHQQQEILQTQIEELQKLQEGILCQQEQHLKEKLRDTKKDGHFLQANLSPLKLTHSQKLQNYISEQSIVMDKSTDSTCANICKENNVKGRNNLSPVLVEDTLMEEKTKDNTLISVQCLNPITVSSSIDTAVQTEVSFHMHEDSFTRNKKFDGKVKADICVGTGNVAEAKADICVGRDDVHEGMDVDVGHGKYGMKTLELCKNHVNKLGEVLKNISCDKFVHKTNLDDQKVNDTNKFVSESTSCKEMTILDDDSDDDNPARRNENNSLSSALQQPHFRPASMLELIDGIHPPSASTSISSSYKKNSPDNERSRRNPLSPTNRVGKVKVKHERAAKLQKVYGTRRNKQGILKQNQVKEKTLEDIEEQKMIADVFFVR